MVAGIEFGESREWMLWPRGRIVMASVSPEQFVVL